MADSLAAEAGSPVGPEAGSPVEAEAGSPVEAETDSPVEQEDSPVEQEDSLAVAEGRPAVDNLVVTIVQMSSYNLNKHRTQAEDFHNWGNMP